jgi:ABC-type glutathione transport system ATPase component
VSNQGEDAVLEARGLSKSFSIVGAPDLKVLNEVNLTLKESSSLSIRGDSGCGKTTLLNVIARLEPESPRILREDDSLSVKFTSFKTLRSGAPTIEKLLDKPLASNTASSP